MNALVRGGCCRREHLIQVFPHSQLQASWILNQLGYRKPGYLYFFQMVALSSNLPCAFEGVPEVDR